MVILILVLPFLNKECIKKTFTKLNMSQKIYWKILCYKKLADFKDIQTHKQNTFLIQRLNL